MIANNHVAPLDTCLHCCAVTKQKASHVSPQMSPAVQVETLQTLWSMACSTEALLSLSTTRMVVQASSAGRSLSTACFGM